jgi:hypothetical protein
MGRELHKLTENQVTRLLYMEMDGARRPGVVVRLHQRLCILRAKREREALMAELRTPLAT